MCPYCQSENDVAKRGFYTRASDKKVVQRFKCRSCQKSFSTQTLRIDYRYRKRHLDQPVFRGICKGSSQRALAFLLSCKTECIARRIKRFGKVCESNLKVFRQNQRFDEVMFDELETFEHTKCKPLTVPIAVVKGKRFVVAVDVGAIAAKGNLAKIAQKKYGVRKCERSKVLKNLLGQLQECTVANATIWTDMSPHYPGRIKKRFPEAVHKTSRGRRGCVVGQGELKRGGFDPLFSLNHTYAMFRDNLKTLSRRTWCTTKRADMLRHLLYMYAWFHNLRLLGDRGTLKTLKNIKSTSN